MQRPNRRFVVHASMKLLFRLSHLLVFAQEPLFISATENEPGPNYRLLGEALNQPQVEAIGSAGRFFRSWTASSLSGSWKALATTEGTPFAGANNVKFSGSAWTKSVSHGELIRSGTDQNLVVNPCKLRYFYQGLDPNKANSNYDTQPWKLGLLTQTNSAC